MARKASTRNEHQSLPEWAWRLRARWSSTLLYQTIRDGIHRVVWHLAGGLQVRANQRRFNPDINHAPKTNDKKPFDRAPIATNVYQTLSSATLVRLLVLHPGSDDEPISVTLAIRSLPDLPSYEALSYCWGAGTSVTITCNGIDLEIQDNLHRALKALRRPDQTRLMWVDALCINQDDLDERSKQILLMRQIYENSSRTIVWLGDQYDDSNLAIELILLLYQISVTTDIKESRTLSADTMQEIGLPPPNSPQWKALGSLMSRSWFSRIWIVQELTVSRDVLVVCGGLSMPWERLAGAAVFIEQSALSTVTLIDQRAPIRLEKFRQMYADVQSDQSMLPMLARGRSSFATDDRDKIFALLGMCADDSRPPFTPNYAITVETVYTDYVKHYIKRTDSLDILGAVEDHSYSLKTHLPSWVPDWEVHPPAVPFILFEQFPSWNACEGSNTLMTADFDEHDKALVVQGLTIDAVQFVGDSFLEFVPLSGTTYDSMPHLKSKQARQMQQSISDFFLQQRFRQWEKIAERIGQHDRAANTSAFVSTVTGEIDLFSPDELANSPATLVDAYRSWRKHWPSLAQYQGQFAHSVYNKATSSDIRSAIAFLEAHHKAAYGRRFFTTKTRRHMGLGPTWTERGDRLVILFGARTPFILRKLGGKNRYRLLGPCYVHNVMRGEVFARGGKYSGDIRPEQFCIF